MCADPRKWKREKTKITEYDNNNDINVSEHVTSFEVCPTGVVRESESAAKESHVSSIQLKSMYNILSPNYREIARNDGGDTQTISVANYWRKCTNYLWCENVRTYMRSCSHVRRRRRVVRTVGSRSPNARMALLWMHGNNLREFSNIAVEMVQCSNNRYYMLAAYSALGCHIECYEDRKRDKDRWAMSK